MIGMMKDKYGLITTKRARGKPFGAQVITLPRIAAAFPVVTVTVFGINCGRALVDEVDVVGRAVGWPLYFMAPMIASVIPHVGKGPLAQLLAIAVAIDDLLHKTDAKTGLSALYKYLNVSYMSKVVDAKTKMKKCEEWGIVRRIGEQECEFVPVIRDSREACIRRIRERRADDKDLDKILSLL